MKLTAGRARLIRGVLEEVATLASAPVGLISRAAEAIAFLRPAKKRTELKYQAPIRPAAERPTTSAIRAACVARANGLCECGCTRMLGLWGAEMDHWLGGWGRRKQKESVETCWMLTLKCHAARQQNSPSIAEWNRRFAIHCEKHGYPMIARIERIPMRRRVG